MHDFRGKGQSLIPAFRFSWIGNERALNRVTNLVDAVGTNQYVYAAGGELYTEGGPFAADIVAHYFNNRMRVGLWLQQLSGTWTNGFGYDAAKRLTTVLSPAGAFNYLLPSTRPSTLVTRPDLPNTSYLSNAYDSVARLLFTKLMKGSSKGVPERSPSAATRP